MIIKTIIVRIIRLGMPSSLIMRFLNQKACKLERRNRVYFIQIGVGNLNKTFVLKLSTLFQGISLIDSRKIEIDLIQKLQTLRRKSRQIILTS